MTTTTTVKPHTVHDRSTRARLSVAGLVTTAGIVVATTTVAAPAGARPVHEPTAASTRVSPYAIPLDALGGRTLATYLAAHRAHDHRLR